MNLLTTGQVKASLKKKWVTISRSPTFTMNQWQVSYLRKLFSNKNTFWIYKRRPCTFGHSLWYTNCPVNFSFFWSTKFFLVQQIFFWCTKFFFGWPNFFFGITIFFWYAKFFLGWPNFFLVYQKNEKLTGQLVYQRDWPKVHGRRYCFPLYRQSYISQVL